MDWMKRNDVEYGHMKRWVYDRKDWLHWRPGLPEKAEHSREWEKIMMQCAALNPSNRCIIFSSAH